MKGYLHLYHYGSGGRKLQGMLDSIQDGSVDGFRLFGDGNRPLFGEGRVEIRPRGYVRNHRFVAEEKGSQVITVVRLPSIPVEHILWSTFTLHDFDEDFIKERYSLFGLGWMLDPPQFLGGVEFEAFLQECQSQSEFVRVDHHPYWKRLTSLAEAYHRSWADPGSIQDSMSFCHRLQTLLPQDRGVKKLTAFIEDRGRKISTAHIASHSASRPEAAKRVMREIAERRGQPAFRQRLLAAYVGRCAITGCNAEAALEAAHIIPYDGPATDKIDNGLLLRADIHTLFDLDLIRIEPTLRTVVLDDSLRGSSYAELHGRSLAEPTSKDFRPTGASLAARWKNVARSS